jgi:diguanylate cyclase (GGDEF)-like protein
MTPPPTPTRSQQLLSLATTLRRVRVLCLVFAAVQFTFYEGPPGVAVPHEVKPWGVAVCAWLLLVNTFSRVATRRDDDVRRLERAAAVEIAADAALVLFVIALLSFDPYGTEWGLLAVVALEAALRLGALGAVSVWLATSGVYIVIVERAHARYGLFARWTLLSFRLGMVLVIGLIALGLATQLRRHLEAARRAREEADERARLLRIAADAGRTMATMGGDDVLDAVVTAAVEMGFDGVDLCVLDEVEQVWRLERSVNMPASYVAQGQAADVGVSGRVLAEARTVIIGDYAGWDGALPDVLADGFSTVVGVPVRVSGEIIATLGVGTKGRRPIAPAELECLELLAAQAGAALDATRRQHYEQGLHAELAHTVAHDRLTGLPNRAALLARLDELLDGSGEIAVVVCDLDAFKTLNDSLGHQAGDQLLCAVADRLRATAGERLVARLAGDEFAVVVERGGIEAGNRLARMILVDLRDALEVEGNRLLVSMSIGVAAEDQWPATDASSLLRDAGLAMERAKQGGRGRFEAFDSSLRLRAHLRLTTETDLRAAVADGAITVAYQPMVSLETGAIVGVEALARWTHPTRGAISPDGFIPLAEETGLIHDLGRRVLEQACRQARAWQQLSPPWRDGLSAAAALRVSVNLSAVQLADDGCVDMVAAVLHSTGLRPEHLTLEITESAVMEDVPSVLRSVQALAALGVRLAVDDLGRGWSSLAYLTRYPLSEIKVDRSFVHGVARRPADRAVIRSLVSLAHDLGLVIVAEGIEDADQLAELSRLGCDVGQGFHLHRPQAAAEITELVAGGASLRVR